MQLTPHVQQSSSLKILERCDRFVGRTTNWLYDHMRFVPRHAPVVLCDWLENRQEFPELVARTREGQRLLRRLWRRTAGERVFLGDRWWLRRWQPQVLHSHFGYVAGDDLALQRLLGVPWVVSFYGADVFELGRQAQWLDTYGRVFEQASRVLALGPVMAQSVQALGCPPSKIVVHPLGVDVATLPAKPRVLRRGEVLKVLFAGTFRAKKGVEYVIRGAARARQQGVPLHVTLVGDASGKPGDQETKEAIFREIEALGLADSVTHHPFLSFADLVQLALACHVFVAPSVTASGGDAEGTPFVLQQMMATGMPAIATLHSDIPYLFGEHEHLLVRERDAEAIARRLEEYAATPERLQQDGTALRERISSAFDVRACAARLAQLYDAV